MNIMLGNLTVDEIERRSGVSFSEDLKSLMKATHQLSATNIADGEWHCFDMPFTLVCGGMPFAKKIYDHLRSQTKQFVEPLQIALAPASNAEVTK
jgi:hypothetical protein